MKLTKKDFWYLARHYLTVVIRFVLVLVLLHFITVTSLTHGAIAITLLLLQELFIWMNSKVISQQNQQFMTMLEDSIDKIEAQYKDNWN